MSKRTIVGRGSRNAAPRGSVMRERAITRIERLLEGDCLSVVFQPIVDLTTRCTVGVEAFSRFAASPSCTTESWFADAKEVGLGLALELRAVEKALERLDELPHDVFLAVNLSPTAVCSDAFAKVAREAPSRLVVEVTEHAAVDDYHVLKAALGRLRATGVRLAIDDVGAGFSSMAHILRLQPDLLKLDRALVAGIGGDPARQALTRSLVTFAAQVGASIVAEGIECEADELALRVLRVDAGQGFHLGRPVAFDELKLRDAPGDTGSIPSVLVCEDEPVIRALVRASLAVTGCAVIEASSGDQAVELACAKQPHLILLDMKLPGQSGVEVLAALRNRVEFVATPIVMLTASTQRDDRLAAAAAGATDFMSKPFSPAALQALVLRLLPSALGPTATSGASL